MKLIRYKKPVRISKVKPTIIPTPTIQISTEKDIYCLGEEIFVVAGGPSLRNFNFESLQTKHTIVVNKSVFDVPNPNYFISVDYTFLRKVRRKRNQFKAVKAKKFFVADFTHPDLIEHDGQIIDTKFDMAYKLDEYDRVITAQRPLGIGYTFDDFCAGRNSGFCALQLAVILGYKKIYLLGIDLNKQETTHYHEGYGERCGSFNSKLDEYYNYFKAGLEQLNRERPDIQVVSCSPYSRLNSVIPTEILEVAL